MNKQLNILLVALSILILYSCANRGIGPQGGPKDEIPPKVVKEVPINGTVNYHNKVIEIYFDEYLQLDNVSENVMISPPQQRPPEVKAVGKKVTVTFDEDLQDSTTYTIDFGAAICDNNEKNALEGYSFSFATGDMIDTLEVSGIMLNAADLNPISGIVVGIHRNLEDSALMQIPFSRIGKTDKDGKFVIKNIHEADYRVYGLKDVSKDYLYQPGEGLAIYDSIIHPSFHRDVISDTLWMDSISVYTNEDGEKVRDTIDIVDTIMEIEKTFYEPSSLVLMYFDEDKTRQYFVRCIREKQHLFQLIFAAPQDSMPKIRAIKPISMVAANDSIQSISSANDSIQSISSANDSILNDSLASIIADSIAVDSIQSVDKKAAKKALAKEKKERKQKAKKSKIVEVVEIVQDSLPQYEDVSDHWTDFALFQANKTNDTISVWLTDSLAIRLDTLTFEMTYLKSDSLYQLQPQTDTIRAIYRAPRLSAKAKEALDKKNQNKPLEWKSNASNTFDVYNPLIISCATPIAMVEKDSIHLLMKQDTSYIPVNFTFRAVDSIKMTYEIVAPWEPEKEYRYVADSAAFTDVYGCANNYKKEDFKVRSLDEYSTLIIKLDPYIENAVIQVLDDKDKVVKELPSQPEGAKFEYLKPTTYYLRLFVDEDGNGKWTTGDLQLKRKPEQIYYFPSKLSLRANWDFEETWDIYKVPILKQKPKELIPAAKK